MPAVVKILPMLSRAGIGLEKGVSIVSTVSKGSGYERQLSPFLLGPCPLYRNYVSRNMENGWQFAKVYKEHLHPLSGRLKPDYWNWAKKGWKDANAHRYPMGRGRKPEFSLWDGERLEYVEARKRIYVPLYYHAVRKTEAWTILKRLYKSADTLVLLDFDAYDHAKLDMTLTGVLNNPHRKMGHAFVLAMMLQQDEALVECDI